MTGELLHIFLQLHYLTSGSTKLCAFFPYRFYIFTWKYINPIISHVQSANKEVKILPQLIFAYSVNNQNLLLCFLHPLCVLQRNARILLFGFSSYLWHCPLTYMLCMQAGYQTPMNNTYQTWQGPGWHYIMFYTLIPNNQSFLSVELLNICLWCLV